MNMTVAEFKKLTYDLSEEHDKKDLAKIAQEEGIDEKYLEDIFNWMQTEPGTEESFNAFEVIKKDISENRPEGMTDEEIAEDWKEIVTKARGQVEGLEQAWKNAKADKKECIEDYEFFIKVKGKAEKTFCDKIAERNELLEQIKAEKDAKKLIELKEKESLLNADIDFSQKEIRSYDSVLIDIRQDLFRTERELKDATREYQGNLLIQSLPIDLGQAEKNYTKMEAGFEKGDALKDKVEDLGQDYREAGNIFSRAARDIEDIVKGVAYDLTHSVEQMQNERRLRDEMRAAKMRFPEKLEYKWNNYKFLREIKAYNKLERHSYKLRERVEKALIYDKFREFRRENGRFAHFDAELYKRSDEFKAEFKKNTAYLEEEKAKQKEKLKETMQKISQLSVKQQEKFYKLANKERQLKEAGEIKQSASFSQDLKGILEPHFAKVKSYNEFRENNDGKDYYDYDRER